MSKKQQTFRRVLTFVLAMVLALGFLSTLAFTVGAEDGNIDFDDLINAGLPGGACGENVKWVLKDGTLTIAGTGAISDFEEYDEEDPSAASAPWSEYRSDIVTIVVEEGVTYVGDYAFDSCINVTEVTLADTVEGLGMCAFQNCKNLTAIELPEGLETIGVAAFNICRKLETVHLPASLKRIEEAAFYECDSLTEVYYGGAPVHWDQIVIGEDNDLLTGAQIRFAKGNPPVITTQPANAVAPSGSKATATVTATGDGLTYVWYYKKSGASGFTKSGDQTTKTLSVKMSSAWNGAQFYCVITDAYGQTVQSKTVKLYMGNPAKITTQPKVGVAPSGSKAKVTVKASGDGLSYTWYYKKSGASGFTKFGDQTTKTLSVKMAKAWNGAQVYCVVKDKYGTSVKSNTVKLHMGNPVAITTQPKVGVAPSGSKAKVTVKASGDGLSYTWYYKKSGASGFTKFGDQTTKTLSVKMAKAWNGAQVYCVVKDKYGTSVKSDTVKLYMGNPVKLTAKPTNAAAPKGSTAKVTVKATGDGLKYTWYHKNAGAAKYSKASVTSKTYSVKTSSGVNGRYVYCVVTDKYGNSVKTDPVRVYMGKPAKITTQPKSVTVIVGKTGKITVKASGDGLKYTWYAKNKNADTYSKISATSKTCSFKMSDAMNGRQVYCVVTDKYGTSVKSSVVTVTKANLAKITTQPTNAVAAKGSTAKVTVKATGDGLKYQWYYAKKGSSSFKKISGATKATYSLKMSSSNDGRKVYCVVKDKYGTSVKTKTVTLYMGKAAKITTQPKNVKVAPNQTAKVTVKASGDGLSYTWYHKSAGAAKYSKSSVTSKTYSVKMKSSVDGYYVYCVVKDKYGTTVKSSVARLYMGNPAKITTQPKSVKVAPNQTAKLTVKASGDGLKYAWYYMKSGATKYTKSGDQTTKTLSLKMTSAWNGAKFYCVITDQYGTSVKTNVVKMTMGSPVKITAHPQDVTVAEGEAAKTTVQATGDGLKYVWYQKDASADAFTASSVTSATYSVTMSEAVDGRQVYCIVSDQYGNKAMSNPATLTMEAKKPQIDWTMGTWEYTGLFCEGEYNVFELRFAGDGSFGTVDVAYWQVLSQTELEGYLEMGWSMEDFRLIEGQYYVNFHGTFRDFRVTNQSGNTLTLVVDYGEDGENIGTLVLELQEDKSLKILSVDNFISDDALHAGKFFTWAEPEPSQLAMITAYPKGVMGDYGDTVTLTVEAEGENLTYQWYKIVIDEETGMGEEVLVPEVTGNTYSVVLTEDNVGTWVYCKVLDDAYHYDRTNVMLLDHFAPGDSGYGFVNRKVTGDKQNLYLGVLFGGEDGSLNITKYRPLREGEEPMDYDYDHKDQDVVTKEYVEVDGIRYYMPFTGWWRSVAWSYEGGLVKASIREGDEEVAAICFQRTDLNTLVVVSTSGTISDIPGFIENIEAGDVYQSEL